MRALANMHGARTCALWRLTCCTTHGLHSIHQCFRLWRTWRASAQAASRGKNTRPADARCMEALSPPSTHAPWGMLVHQLAAKIC